MSDTITLPLGGDFDYAFTWRGGDGAALNLVDYDLEVFEAHPALTGFITAVITDAATGRVGGRASWQPDMPEGRQMTFRLRLVPKPTAVVPPPVRRPIGPLWILVK
jgi:hypothetical protein